MEELKTEVFLNTGESTADRRNWRKQDDEQGIFRGQLWPVKRRVGGQKEFGLPSWMLDAYDAFTLPRDVLMNDYKPTLDDATNFAGTVGVGGGATSTITAPAADVGMFLGRKAAGADKKKLAVAMIQDSRGVDREQIWKDTGWWKKPDGDWAWEMADDDLAVAPEVMNALKFIGGGSTSGKAKDIIRHPRLFDQYAPTLPTEDQVARGVVSAQDVENMKDYGGLVGSASVSVNPEGSTHGVAKTDIGRLEVTIGKDDKPRELVAHELQHFVQAKERWKGLGYNPEAAQQMIDEVDKMAPESWNRVKIFEKEIMEGDEKITELGNLVSLTEDALRTTDKGDVLNQLLLGEELTNHKAELSMWSEYVDDLYRGKSELTRDPEFQAYAQARDAFEEQFGREAFEIYRNNEGEALANLTAQRLSLTPEERKMVPPWLMYGSPDPIFKDLNIPWEDRLWKEGDFSKFKKENGLGLLSGSKEPKANELGAIDVYHGTPHDFDKFDWGKIGTGEGAQAYGYGHYFAGDKGIAKFYRDKLSKKQSPYVLKDGQGNVLDRNKYYIDPYTFQNPLKIDPEEIAEELAYKQKLLKRAKQHKTFSNPSVYKNPREWLEGDERNLQDLSAQVETLENLSSGRWRVEKEAKSGSLYNVELNAEDDDLLHFDVPFSKQPEKIRQKLAPFMLTDKEVDKVIDEIEKRIDPDAGVFATEASHKVISTLDKEAMEVAKEDPRAALKAFQFNMYADIYGQLQGKVPAVELRDRIREEATVGNVIHYVMKQFSRTMEDALYPPEQFYNGVAEEVPELLTKSWDQKTTDFFKALGIKGLKYLDSNSRREDMTKPNYNYVIYDDKDIVIKGKE